VGKRKTAGLVLRLSLSLSFVIQVDSQKAEGEGMPDWIDRLAAGERAQAETARKTQELRLHNAKIIAVKAPQFWNAVIDAINRDAAKLRAAFPNDNSKHCSIIPIGNAVKVQGAKLPWRILELELKVDGQCVEVFESQKLSRQDTTPAKGGQIEIKVGNDEELQFIFKHQTHTEPDSLAQHVVTYVCGMNTTLG
jgi:hypothetical protein